MTFRVTVRREASQPAYASECFQEGELASSCEALIRKGGCYTSKTCEQALNCVCVLVSWCAVCLRDGGGNIDDWKIRMAIPEWQVRKWFLN